MGVGPEDPLEVAVQRYGDRLLHPEVDDRDAVAAVQVGLGDVRVLAVVAPED